MIFLLTNKVYSPQYSVWLLPLFALALPQLRLFIAFEIADLQTAFQQRNALQCGFCTPGMLLTAQELLSRGGVPTREAIRDHISGNYCRCTGYQAIVDAIEAVAQQRAGARS